MVETSVWATHKVRCKNCGKEYPVAFGSNKAKLLRSNNEVTDDCPNCGNSIVEKAGRY